MTEVKHLGDMFHCDSQTKESTRPAAHNAPVTPDTKSKQRLPGEKSKAEIEQLLAEHRKRIGIIPGQMAVLRDPSSQLVEQPWMKWTPEEKKQAFDEYRKYAGIVPHGKQVAEATTSAGSSRSDTRQSLDYAPKPTHNPNVAVQQENDNGDKDSNSDTQMHDTTAKEEKSSTQTSRSS